jgi:ABC-type bacteriocin/lantibiotic exporter with double-glycine peptidase domain
VPRFSIPVPHRQQELDYSCCPACVCMVLAFYGAEHAEKDLRILLRTRIAGTSAVNVMLKLPELGFTATVTRATFYELMQAVREGRPCIVQVFTEHLHYWDIGWMHDVVVVGFDEDVVLVNDPAFPDAPKEVPQGEFLAAWAAADQLVIRISRTDA